MNMLQMAEDQRELHIVWTV